MAKSREQKLVGDKTVSLFRKRKLLASLVVLFLALTAILTVVTLYGLHTGGFTMSIADDLASKGIKLYENPNATGQTKLNGPEMSKVQPMGQPEVNEYYVINNDGAYKSKAGDYIGYTFYLKNEGNEAVDIQSKFRITEVSRHMDEAVRFWLFTTIDDTKDETGKIYQKKDPVDADGKPLVVYENIKTGFGDYRKTEEFEDESTVVTDVYKQVQPGSSIKISIIMWLEGADPNCSDALYEGVSASDIKGGSIKISMAFTAYKEKLV